MTTTSTINNGTLQIGFLSSFRYGLGKIIAGAIPLAIQHINEFVIQILTMLKFNVYFYDRDEAILPDHRLDFIGKTFQLYFSFERKFLPLLQLVNVVNQIVSSAYKR